MKNFSEMMVCGGCRTVMPALPLPAGCSRCGSSEFSVYFVPKDGSLVVWDEKIEEIFPENIFLRCLERLIRRVL